MAEDDAELHKRIFGDSDSDDDEEYQPGDADPEISTDRLQQILSSKPAPKQVGPDGLSGLPQGGEQRVEREPARWRFGRRDTHRPPPMRPSEATASGSAARRTRAAYTAPDVHNFDCILIKHDDESEAVVESTRATFEYLRVLKRSAGGGVGIEVPEVKLANLPPLSPSEYEGTNDGSDGVMMDEVEERKARRPRLHCSLPRPPCWLDGIDPCQ